MLATPEALARLGAALGDEVVVKDPEARFTLVGTMKSRLDENAESMVFVPEEAPFQIEPYWTTWYAEGWHPSADDVYALNALGVVVFDRELVRHPGEGASPMLNDASGTSWAFYSATAASLVFCAYLVMLLAGAAFSVSAKRQQRALAVAASVGASRADVFRIVLFQGAIMGLAGGVLGSAAGIGLAVLARALFGDGSLSYTWGLKVPWWAMIGLVLFATIVGTLSALLPARAATRGDTLAALRGARRPVTVSAKRPRVGLALIVAGVALVAAATIGLVIAYNAESLDYEVVNRIYVAGMIGMIVGPLLLQIGVVTAGHWLLAHVSRLVSRWGLGGRLAARDAVANPGRSVPSFGAIAACAFLATASIGGVATLMNREAEYTQQPAPSGSVVVSVSGYEPPTEGATENQAALVPHVEQLVTAVDEALREAGAETTVTMSVPIWPVGTVDDDGAVTFGDDLTMPTPEIVRPSGCELEDECLRSFYERSGGGGDRFVVVEPDELATAVGGEVSSEQRQAYADGDIVVTDPMWLDSDGDVVVNRWRVADLRGGSNENFWVPSAAADQPAPVAHDTFTGILVETPTSFSEGLQVYIAPQTAEALGIATIPSYVVADIPDITTAQLDALSARAESEALSTSTDDLTLSASAERIAPPPAAAPWLWLILGAVTVLVVAASAVSLGLSRVERRPDDATLTAVGAAPGVRRAVNAWQAFVISGFGCIVGTVAGLMPVLGVVYILDGTGQSGLTLAGVPWLWYGLLALALPFAVALASWLVPPRAPDLTRRTAIA
jgi:hypothetical protein